MTTRKTRVSGTFKTVQKFVLPSILPAPRFYQLAKTQFLIADRLLYAIKHYGNDGISVLVARDGAEKRIAVACGDWNGNKLDLKAKSRHSEAARQFIEKDITKLINVMSCIKLEQAQYFLAFDGSELRLVDMQISLNKFAGPGMLRDIFGNVMPTQEVIKVEPFDDRVRELIVNGTGSYSDSLILKPSKFSMFNPVQELFVPLYTVFDRQ